MKKLKLSPNIDYHIKVYSSLFQLLSYLEIINYWSLSSYHNQKLRLNELRIKNNIYFSD